MDRLTRTFAIPALALALTHCARESVVTPPNYGDVARAHPRFVWDSVTAKEFTLYTNRGGYAAARALQYRDEVQAAFSHALAVIGETRFPEHARVFVFGSREDVEAVTGIGWGGWGDAAGRNLGVVARAECAPAFRHEVMHVVSLLLWGHPLGGDKDPHPPSDPAVFQQGGWLREGIAAAAEDRYGAYSYRGMAAQWQAERGLIPLDTLAKEFYRQDDFAAYLQAGSLVQYLLDQYGIAPLRWLWRDGTRAFERAYSKSASQIESEWHAWLVATPDSARPRSIAVARAEDRCPPRRK